MNLFQKFLRRSEAEAEPKIIIGRAGRDVWVYREGDRKMRIHAELLAGNEGVVIYFNSSGPGCRPTTTKALD